MSGRFMAEKGQVIGTHEQFAECLTDKRVVTVRRFFKGRPTSIVFVANMSYSLVSHLLRNGYITLHDKKPEEIPF